LSRKASGVQIIVEAKKQLIAVHNVLRTRIRVTFRKNANLSTEIMWLYLATILLKQGPPLSARAIIKSEWQCVLSEHTVSIQFFPTGELACHALLMEQCGRKRIRVDAKPVV